MLARLEQHARVTDAVWHQHVAAAARTLERIPAIALENDLATLRKLLRDPSPLVQLEAAAGLLRVSGAM